MTIQEIRDAGLLEYYVLGLLSDEEVTRVEGYIKAHPELQKDYVEIQLAMQEYAKSQGITPSVDLQDRIKQLIRAEGVKDPVTPGVPPIAPPVIPPSGSNGVVQAGNYGWARGLAVLLGVVSLAALWYGWSKNEEYKALAQSHAALQSECDSVAQVQSERLLLLDGLSHPANRTLNFTPTEGYPQTQLLFHINNESKQNYIQVKNLPALEGGQAFQLWSLKDGVDPIPLNVFDGQGDFFIPVDFVDDTHTYAITIEPEGGSTVPTLTRLIGTVGV